MSGSEPPDDAGPRGRPEYGEYATPEEQAEAIRAAGGRPETHRTPASGAGSSPAAPARRPDARRPVGSRDAVSKRPGEAGLVNRFATILLLSIGLFSLLQSTPGYLNMAGTLGTFYASQDIGSYEAGPLTAPVGIASLVVHVIVWSITAWISVALLRKGRQSWWVPIVGAVLAFAIVVALVSVLLLQDPVFLEYITTRT